MEPLYEFKDEQPGLKYFLAALSIMFLAMAVFLPWPEDTSFLEIWGMRAIFVFFGALSMVILPVVRLRAYPEYLEIRFGPTALISFRLSNAKITSIRAVEYSPMRDFGGWGIKGGGGKWKGWTSFTATGAHRVLSIETTEKNYLVSCPNPDEAEVMLTNIVRPRKGTVRER